MTSLYNELYAHGWFGLAQVKQEAMHEHHRKKDKQTRAREWGKEEGGGGGGAGKKKVLTSSGSTPKSLQSFSTPSGPMVSGSSWPLSSENKNWKFNLITWLHN